MSKAVATDEEDLDDKAFMALLYASYHRLMRAEIRKYILNAWDVEDVLQSSAVKLLGKCAKLRSLDRDRRVDYILATSRNTALNFLRDSKRHAAFSYDEEYDWETNQFLSSEDRLELIEKLEDANKAWNALNTRNKRILKMKYMLDKSDEEIAEEIQVNVSSVRMLLSRARKKMKENMRTNEQ